MVNKWFNYASSLMVPHYCILCDQSCPAGTSNIDLCAGCHEDLPTLPAIHCNICALPLSASETSNCGDCLKKPPSFNKLVAGWLYQHPVDELISQFKYQHKPSHGKVLATLLALDIKLHYGHQPLPQLLIPTPLHWRRRWQRGFNQSELLARPLSKQLDIPISRSLIRQLHTPKQQGQSAQQRKQSLRYAFKVKQKSALQGLTVAIIDDVVTTTATAEAMSRCLLKAGAAEVHIWCLARTPKNR